MSDTQSQRGLEVQAYLQSLVDKGYTKALIAEELDVSPSRVGDLVHRPCKSMRERTYNKIMSLEEEQLSNAYDIKHGLKPVKNHAPGQTKVDEARELVRKAYSVGLSYTDIGKVTGVHEMTINNIEKGKTTYVTIKNHKAIMQSKDKLKRLAEERHKLAKALPGKAIKSTAKRYVSAEETKEAVEVVVKVKAAGLHYAVIAKITGLTSSTACSVPNRYNSRLTKYVYTAIMNNKDKLYKAAKQARLDEIENRGLDNYNYRASGRLIFLLRKMGFTYEEISAKTHLSIEHVQELCSIRGQ